MRHGVSGYQLGCRCTVCGDAESARARNIAQAEQERWSRINLAADKAFRSQLGTAEIRPRTNRKRWTYREIALAIEEDLTSEDVAARVGRSVEAVEALRRLFARRHNHAHRKRQ